VTKAGFITASGPFEDPVSHFRVALLTVATALSAIFLSLLITVAPTQHGIKVDLWDPGLWPDPVPDRPVHVLAIGADGAMTFNGAPVVDLRALRDRIDLDQQAVPVPMLRVEPDPNVRYAAFLDALAEIAHANVRQYCIDFDVARLNGKLRCGYRPAFE
jgi:biopolymer transport protein ExbD